MCFLEAWKRHWKSCVSACWIKLTLVTESCTGGLIGHLLTEAAGSSAYFLRILSYSNEVKIVQLGVPSEVIEEHGAVSEACARAMAERAWRG